MKQIFTLLLAAVMVATPIYAEAPALTISAPSAILMEKETGAILFEQDANVQMEPASVTKIMTMLLIMEGLESGRIQKDDMVTTSANAAGQGGSQVFLKEGEQMPLWEMMKCVAVASANDGSVALAEHLYGSVESFVSQMNDRAQALGMTNTHFENPTGLPAEGHVSTAHDIAIMSRALILNHPDLRELTTIWMDSIRDGSFGLSNTNHLIRFYPEATGLKTGHTASAKFCMSATAEKDGMELIAVVLGAPSSPQRFEDAKTMLNYGFSNYSLVDVYPDMAIAPIPVEMGEADFIQPELQQNCRLLIQKGQESLITTELDLFPSVPAPVTQGQPVGEFTVYVDGQAMQTIPLLATGDVPRLTIPGIFTRMLHQLLMAQ